jgi:hypothetical protein
MDEAIKYADFWLGVNKDSSEHRYISDQAILSE